MAIQRGRLAGTYDVHACMCIQHELYTSLSSTSGPKTQPEPFFLGMSIVRVINSIVGSIGVLISIILFGLGKLKFPFLSSSLGVTLLLY